MKDTDLPLDSEKQICAHADMSDGIPRGICHVSKTMNWVVQYVKTKYSVSDL